MKNSEKFRRLRRILVFTVAIAILASVSTSFFGVRAAPSLSAESAVLMDFDSGAVLLDSNANERMGMASTTKIMTALIALETLDEEEIISANEECCGIDGSSLYLRPGETMNAIMDVMQEQIADSGFFHAINKSQEETPQESEDEEAPDQTVVAQVPRKTRKAKA